MPTNKEIMTAIFAETAKGNGQLYVDALADDVKFRCIGTTSWSGEFNGKSHLLAEVYARVAERIDGPITTAPTRIIGEGDFVAVQAKGSMTMKDGRPYHNDYCMVFRLKDGKIVEITEYLDTELATSVLGQRV